MKANTAVIGLGNIGKAIYEKLSGESEYFAAPSLIVTSRYVFDGDFNKLGESKDFKRFTDRIDLAFLAVPTDNSGEVELDYISHFIDRNSKVVTCAKAAAAFHYNKISDLNGVLGMNASVGGHTGMIGFVRKIRQNYNFNSLRSLEGVVNGSLNYLWDKISQGVPQNKALYMAIKKGFTESADFDFISSVLREINDARLKATILANESCFPEILIHPREVTLSENIREIVNEAVSKSKEYRFIVRMGSEEVKPIDHIAFSSIIKGFRLYGGFEHLKNLQRNLQIPEESNRLTAIDCKGKYHEGTMAAGAGPEYVVGMMMCDGLKLLGRQQQW